MKKSLRKTPAHPRVQARRVRWGARVRAELENIGRSPLWLGRQVRYKNPASMRQVVNGHQGISRAIYNKIILLLPGLRRISAPPIMVERQGRGAPGPHKKHDYPKLGPKETT